MSVLFPKPHVIGSCVSTTYVWRPYVHPVGGKVVNISPQHFELDPNINLKSPELQSV